MRNFFTDEEITSRYYSTESTTPGSATPKSKELPALNQSQAGQPGSKSGIVTYRVVHPTPKMILYALTELLEGRLPVLPGEIMRFD